MFYQSSGSRELLSQWVGEIIDWITFDSPDRASLDLLTASEVLDLTYLEGEELTNCIAANALIPSYLEQSEQHLAFGANSTMNVLFPVKVEKEHWGFKIQLRAGLPSMLAIGQQGYFPRSNPTGTLPVEIRSPKINNLQYDFQEPGGKRLRTLAGPLKVAEYAFTYAVSEANGMYVEDIIIPSTILTYAYVNEQGKVHLEQGDNGLQPLAYAPNKFRSFYLRQQSSECKLHLEISWKRLGPEEVHMSITLQNRTALPQDRQARARHVILSALVLPHLHVTLNGALANFPEQQYAQVKQKVLRTVESERYKEAERRLYQVRQSGCIATLNPKDNSRLSMTTFGIFDTPRETPLEGPDLEQVTQNAQVFLKNCPGHSAEMAHFVQQYWLIIRSILLAAGKAFNLKNLYQFQWDAIITGLELEATGRERVVIPICILSLNSKMREKHH